MFQSQHLGIFFRFLALLILAQTANAATNIVTSSADDNSPGTLRRVISNSVSGDTITFDPNLSGQTILLTTGRIILSNSLTLDASQLAARLIIDGNTNGRIFQVFSNTTVAIDSLTLTNGRATVGGGIANQGALTLNRCTVTGNSSSLYGGGIYNVGGLTLSNCTISGNSAAMDGGGIYDEVGLTIKQSTLSGNSSVAGGALYSKGLVTISQSTVAGNHATSGGGIYAGDMVMDQCTVAGNDASNGGGIFLLGPQIWSLANSIVAGNTSSDNQNIHILIGIVPSPPFVYSGVNITGGNPLLAPLGNYGGPTQTMPPLPTSPAVDGCTNGTSFTTDQRGFPRPLDGNGDTIATADIGAVEGFVYYGPGVLTGAKKLGNGMFQFGFPNTSGQSFTVFVTTNLATPFAAWLQLGPAFEIPPGSGQYQFTDQAAENYPQRFYHVRSP